MDNGKIKSFTDLVAWQRGHQLVITIYAITVLFPQHEIYALTTQMRRAVVSITSNVAEGFSRNTYKEKIQFYYMALGSLTELHNQIIIARDIHYIDTSTFRKIVDDITAVQKLINGLIKFLKETHT